jgi:SPP1 family predicted phage head-tail adaptor
MIGGALDRRIVIQNKSEVIDVYGQRTLSWATFLTVWSNPVQAVSMAAGERNENNNRTTGRMVDFRVRYNSTITNEMRIIWDGDYYKIEDIKELSRQDGLMIRTSLLAQT